MSTNETISYHGFHHIALATGNLEETLAFYQNVLGMQASKIHPSKEGRGRQALVFLKEGDNDIWGFHFFERLEAGRKMSNTLAAPPSEFLLHIALRLSTEAAAQAVRERLQATNVSITDIPALGTFVFPDNNGIMLEATWPRKAVS
jgi:catechol 2,3-dioxygenase-like lactoylglutathione lyase family enzyme